MYPQIAPTGMEFERHTRTCFYGEEVGNPRGFPSCFFTETRRRHQPTLQKIIDPKKYRAVLFDQRGFAKAGPMLLQQQRHPSLVEDIELLRQHLGIDKWIVMGGSWDPHWRSHMRFNTRHKFMPCCLEAYS